MPGKYKPISLTVDTVIFAKTGEGIIVLLIKRKNEPFKEKWAIPGGFVDYDEELHDAARRELKEETGVTDAELEQVYTVGTLGRDPRGRTVSVVYSAFVDINKVNVQAGDDAKEAEWFKINELPDLAFDHRDVMDYVINHHNLMAQYCCLLIILNFED